MGDNLEQQGIPIYHTSSKGQQTRHFELGWSRAMAKSIRSKVKKRLRTVKRGVIKSQLDDPSSKVGTRRTAVLSKLAEAATGHIAPGERA